MKQCGKDIKPKFLALFQIFFGHFWEFEPSISNWCGTWSLQVILFQRNILFETKFWKILYLASLVLRPTTVHPQLAHVCQEVMIISIYLYLGLCYYLQLQKAHYGNCSWHRLAAWKRGSIIGALLTTVLNQSKLCSKNSIKGLRKSPLWKLFVALYCPMEKGVNNWCPFYHCDEL